MTRPCGGASRRPIDRLAGGARPAWTLAADRGARPRGRSGGGRRRDAGSGDDGGRERPSASRSGTHRRVGCIGWSSWRRCSIGGGKAGGGSCSIATPIGSRRRMSAAREPDPLDWLLADERKAMVRQALAKLPPRDAEILLLKYTRGLVVPAVGRTFGAERECRGGEAASSATKNAAGIAQARSKFEGRKTVNR